MELLCWPEMLVLNTIKLQWLQQLLPLLCHYPPLLLLLPKGPTLLLNGLASTVRQQQQQQRQSRPPIGCLAAEITGPVLQVSSSAVECP